MGLDTVRMGATTVTITSIDIEPEVEAWLGREIRLLACDQCNRLTTDYVVTEVFVEQEGGTLPWVTCQACLDAWDAS